MEGTDVEIEIAGNLRLYPTILIYNDIFEGNSECSLVKGYKELTLCRFHESSHTQASQWAAS